MKKYTVSTINIDKDIGIKEWERFEELGDSKEELWEIFRNICNDKKNIIKRNMCRVEYFSDYVMPSLEEPMRNFITEKNITKTDIEIILALYTKLLPKTKCDTCDCVNCFIKKMSKHYKLDFNDDDNIG